MKYIHWLLFTALCGLFLFMFLDSLAYLFPYHEQQNLFLFSHAYLDTFLSTPGKLGEYLANFIVQFFYLPYTGKIIFTFILSLLYLFPVLCCKQLTGKHDPLHLVILPPLYLFVQFESLGFEISWATSLFCCFFLLFMLSLLPKKIFYITLLPFFLLTSFALGWIYPAIAILICVVTLLSALFFSRFGKNRKIYIGGGILCLGIYAAGTFYLFVYSYNMRERLLLEAEGHLKKQEWEQVLDCTRKYRGENQLNDYFRNMALYHTGRMPYDLLNYSQSYGINSLFLPWTGDAQQSRYGHYIYEQLGYLNEAQRRAFESLVVNGETVPNLTNLIRYNIANGRPEVALRFIRILKQSLFYRKQAEEYEKIAYTGQIRGLKALPHAENKKARFSNIQNLGPELIYICDRDSSNQMAFEYLMSYLILSNRQKQFVENLPRIQAFSYPGMPPLYQEILNRYQQDQQ